MQKGDHVVLINDDWTIGTWPRVISHFGPQVVFPQKGKVYTIRSTYVSPSARVIWLDEITNPGGYFLGMGMVEIPFGMDRFRRLQKLTLQTLTANRNPLDDPKRKDNPTSRLRQRVAKCTGTGTDDG